MLKNNIQKYEDSISIIIIGDSKVGKTTLMKRYINGHFTENIIPSLGIELYRKIKEINRKKYLIKIWDTCGQERFRSITQNYYRNADGVMLLFDSNNIESFHNLNIWLNSLKEYSIKNFPLIIIGTKSDLPINVHDNDINIFCNQFNIKWFRTSAKTGENISISFDFLTKEILNIKHNNREKIKIKVNQNTNENSCC
jgi:small GTP-binding protein